MGRNEYQEEEAARPKKKKKKSHKVYAFMVLVMGIAIIALAVLILFYVQKIEVEGNEYCKDKEIINTVQNDRFSINSLYILGKYALGRGGQVPCLDSMKVSMKTPWIVKVKVKEKPIVGYIYAGNEYAYFDKEGMIVYKGADFIEGLPCIEGIETGDISLYGTIESKDKSIFEEMLVTSQQVKKYKIAPDKIVCKDDRIYLYKGTIRISLGNSVSSEQIAQIPPILEKLEGKEGTLHLENYSEGNTTITFNAEEIQEEN